MIVVSEQVFMCTEQQQKRIKTNVPKPKAKLHQTLNWSFSFPSILFSWKQRFCVLICPFLAQKLHPEEWNQDLEQTAIQRIQLYQRRENGNEGDPYFHYES